MHREFVAKQSSYGQQQAPYKCSPNGIANEAKVAQQQYKVVHRHIWANIAQHDVAKLMLREEGIMKHKPSNESNPGKDGSPLQN
jgi:hypothetical protein